MEWYGYWGVLYHTPSYHSHFYNNQSSICTQAIHHHWFHNYLTKPISLWFVSPYCITLIYFKYKIFICCMLVYQNINVWCGNEPRHFWWSQILIKECCGKQMVIIILAYPHSKELIREMMSNILLSPKRKHHTNWDKWSIYRKFSTTEPMIVGRGSVYD